MLCRVVCVLCVVRVGVVVVVCGVWCVFGVWCGTQKKPPCVDSKRPRVFRHHARMCQNMRAWWRYTQGRLESTHGGFLDGHTGRGGGEGKGVLLTKIGPRSYHLLERFTERNHWMLQISSLRIGRDLIKLFNFRNFEGNC